ncbi:NEDD8-conjugating enzyme UBE2F-like [Brachionus plicatilis]|uniref:E2 NEDD8-conjugating enzyme n=1 Tax=Brachionus plicatilis TaxID=10195 RepID=A0A3M7RL33_BRAPC|nr:NEDD8-conjugating enzyme UBE2F-like [Brachionus plicatilis]
MFSLQKKLKQEANKSTSQPAKKPVDLRQKLLQKEFETLKQLPVGCSIHFDNPDVLHQFKLILVPDKDSLWYGGRFEFFINVPEGYNFDPPKVTCLTRVWHPNINEKGEVCLSILRQNSIDSFGWLPTRTIADIIFGINSLFYDLVNFEDPLNTEAATMFQNNKDMFIRRVREYINKYCK